MDISDIDEPPSKRRRFFQINPASSDGPFDESLGDSSFSKHTRKPDREDSPILSDSASPKFTENTHLSSSHPAPGPVPTNNPSPPENEPIQPGFDRETFESIVGEVPKDAWTILQAHCGNDINRAINLYLDGAWKKLKRKALAPRAPATPTPSSATVAGVSSNSPASRPRIPSLMNIPESRYIGAFGVEGWATRSGFNLLKHGDPVRIERQKIQVPRLAFGQPGPRISAAAAKRVDVIVRFTDRSGREIGRLAKETANWVSTLMDHKICKFEGTCVYAPERLRTNDTVFLQLRCSLLRTAFISPGFQACDNRAAGRFEEAETSEERDLRLRQVALVKLFQEVNLFPTRGNAAAAKTQREGLLHAVEMEETKDAEKTKAQGLDTSETPSSSEENEEGQELEQDQLDALYKKAQSFDFNTPEAEPADTFAFSLRPYQKQALHWMMAKEKDAKNENREESMHPLWEEYAWPTRDHDDKPLPEYPEQSMFYVNPYSGELSLQFPRQEQHCLGGILADEMGLGKTIQMLSLIHTHRSDIALEARQSRRPIPTVNDLTRQPWVRGRDGTVNGPFTTLVVAPMSLLAQWQSEAENASREGTLKTMIYYGTEKNVDLPTLCCEANAAGAPDVIITSYGVVLSEFTQIVTGNGNRTGTRGIFSVNFFRVILDEAHQIKNRQSKTARACYEIAARHRWVLTGTPIVNRLEDLFSLVRFLRVEPWNNFSYWRTFITVPFESKNYMRALDVVQTVLEPLVMRRTKDMKTPDGTPLVVLPPKTVEIVDVELSKEERDIYNYIFKRAKRAFFANVEAGTVLKAFTSIFAQILRLRQSCCHPLLVRNREVVADEEEAAAASGFEDDMDLQSLIDQFAAATDEGGNSNAFGAHALSQIRDEALNECPICAEEPMVNQTVTACWHSACKNCILDYIRHQTDQHKVPRCWQCRQVINSRELFEVVRYDDDPEAPPNSQGPRISLQRLGVGHSSAKVVALISHLRDLRRENPTMKSVVFSQFTSFLSLIQPALARANMHFLRLDGTMAQKTRAAVLNEFRESKKFTVLLLSLKAGGVGLNLTSAKRVYMMDPWWSFAIEAQAIDRVHRMGQEDEVKVYRFIVKDSVEQRMLKIQDRKKFIATSLGMMSDEEKKLQRIEDIRELLS